MIDFKFALFLHFVCDLLGKTQLLSMQLQAVSIDMAREIELKKLPKRFNSSVVFESVGCRSDNVSKTDFRQNIYFQVLDCVIDELETRFSSNSNSAMIEVRCLNPADSSFLDLDKLSSFAQLYSCNIEDIHQEVYFIERLLQLTQKDGVNITATLKQASFLEP